MRIAWIDYALVEAERKVMEIVFRVEWGLELISESSWERFERKYGPVDSFEELLIHSGINNLIDDNERIKKLKIPVAIGTSSPQDYIEKRKIPVLSYAHKEEIVKFFMQRRK